MANMRASYYLGKIKRYGPLLGIVIILLIVYGYQTSGALTRGSVDERHTVPEPTDPPPPSRWVIVYSEVTSVCNHLAAEFQDWNILLTGVAKTSNYSHSRCHFLKKKKHPGVNMAYGHLYAIQNGAEFIYIPPADEKLGSLSLPRELHTGREYEGLILEPPTSDVREEFDPNVHWGTNVTGQRNVSYKDNYRFCKQKVPIIQTSVTLGPVTKVSVPPESTLDTSSIPYYDKHAPPVSLGLNYISNISHTGTMYHRDAFWALPLVSIKPEWREVFGLFVQKMLWHTGHNMYIYARKITELAPEEHPDRKAVLDFLFDYVCESDLLFKCAKKLLLSMVERKLITSELQRQIHLWFENLTSLGYIPPLIKFGYDQRREIRCLEDPVAFVPVRHTGNIVADSYARKTFIPVINSVSIATKYKELCENLAPKPNDLGSSGVIDFDRPWTQMPNILLIVIYNNPHYESIPYIEALYRSAFPNMVYCGPGHPKPDVFKSLRSYNYTFLSYHSTPKGHTAGAFNYNCTVMAINMHYNVQGYLTINDDLLLQTHSIQKLQTHVVWYIPPKEMRVGEIHALRECKLGMCDFNPHWHWWEDYQNASITVMNHIRDTRHKDRLMHRCYAILQNLNGAAHRPNGGYSDIFYIPDRQAQDFVKLSKLFLEHKVFLEIAVATTIRCLEAPNDIQALPGLQIWDESRETPWSYYQRKKLAGKTYLHPTKWGFLARGNEEYAEFFCKQVMPHLHDKYARINEL